MDRLLPLLWTVFGVATASAAYLPKPGFGAFAAFCAVVVLVVAIAIEIIAERR